MSQEPENRTSPGTHEDEGIPFFPLHMMKEIMVMVGVLMLLFTLATWMPAALEEAADSFKTPPHIKPEWYFLATYQALKYVPQGMAFAGLTFLNLAISAMGLFFGFLAALPFIDRSPHTRMKRRPLFLIVGIGIVIFLVVFTYLGLYSGGRDPIFHILIH